MNAVKQTKSPKLTQNQEQTLAVIKQAKGGYLRAFPKNNGTCWRLMDERQNPIRTFTDGVVKQLIEKEYLIKRDHVIVVK